MSPDSCSWEELRGLSLARQFPDLGGRDAAAVAEAVAMTGPIQSQTARSPYVGLGARLPGVPLADVQVGASVRIVRFENEAEDLLRYLKASGIEPGLKGTLVARDADEVIVETTDGMRCVLTPSVAETVSVIANPSPPQRTALPEQLVLGQRYGR